jgi:uncharacterized protein YrrD
MKRSINSLIGYSIGATDGEIGKVKEFYFDDFSWTVRYVIVETGSWLNGRKVLISPQALLKPDWEGKIFPVNLTKEQIENSPGIDTEKPVSRQQEILLNDYYPWTGYWGGGLWSGGMGTSGMMTQTFEPIEVALKNGKDLADLETHGDPNLRSTHNVDGYSIHAEDGNVGDVEDFIFDDISWRIDFMVVDTGNWFPGKKVLISPGLIKEIDWSTSEVIVKASIAKIKNSPEYSADQLLTEGYAKELHDYYGRVISQERITT